MNISTSEILKIISESGGGGGGGGGGTVKSVQVSGGTTGLTTDGGPVTTSGTITLQGTLATGSGGTGLTTLGSAGQTLQVNSGGSALEYATPSKMSFSLAGQSGSTQTISDSDTVTVTGTTNETTGLVTSTTASATDTIAVEVSGGTLNQANGGTGVDFSTASEGELLIGNDLGSAELGTLTAGRNIDVVNGPGPLIVINGTAASTPNISSMKLLYYDTVNKTFHFLEEKGGEEV
jgi:hypothetical protein